MEVPSSNSHNIQPQQSSTGSPSAQGAKNVDLVQLAKVKVNPKMQKVPAQLISYSKSWKQDTGFAQSAVDNLHKYYQNVKKVDKSLDFSQLDADLEKQVAEYDIPSDFDLDDFVAEHQLLAQMGFPAGHNQKQYEDDLDDLLNLLMAEAQPSAADTVNQKVSTENFLRTSNEEIWNNDKGFDNDEIFATLDLLSQNTAAHTGVEKQEGASESLDVKVSDADYQEAQKYCNEARDMCEAMGDDMLISAEDSKLNYDLQFIAEGPRQGFHILLGKEGILGEGGFFKASLTLPVLSEGTKDQVKPACVRTGNISSASESEIEANKLLQNEPQFAAGTPVIQGDKIAFFMDLARGGELYEKMIHGRGQAPVPQHEALALSTKIASAVAVLHDTHGIVHRDLNSRNVLLAEGGDIKICDFGLCQKSEKALTSQQMEAFTPGQTPPEYGTQVADKSYDIWGMGCIMADLFHGTGWEESMRGLNMGFINFEEPTEAPARVVEAKALHFPERHNEEHIDHIIDRCLSYDPSARPTAQELVALLNAYEHSTS